MPRRKLQYRPLLLSLLTFCLIAQQPDLFSSETGGLFQTFVALLAGYGEFSLQTFLLFPCLWLLFRYVYAKVPSGSFLRPSVIIPAVIFGISMPFGYAFQEAGTLDPIFSSGAAPVLSALAMAAGWAVVADHSIALLYAKAESAGQTVCPDTETPGKGLWGHYCRVLSRNPFLTVFLTLAVLYLPHAVISYPGVFMGDTWQQVVQAYSELGSTGSPYLSPDNIIRAGVYINQNHPAFPTLLLHALLVIGNAVTGSMNTGIAVFCSLQALCLMAAVSYTASLLIRRGFFPLRYAWIIPLFGFINPYIHTSVFLLTKDVFYSSFFLFLFANLFRILTGERSVKLWIWTGLNCLGIILFRNEGRWLLLISFFIAALVCRETRKAFLITFGGMVFISLLVFRLLFPLLGFTPGSIREPFSIPFQQTARCIRDYPDDITEAEQAAIDRVLDFENLADNYDPDLSDPVKSTFRESASSGDLLEYFRVWFNMGFRHPDAYLQALLNKNYQHFYPGKTRLYLYDYSWSNINYQFTNQKIAPLNRSFSQIEGLAPARAMHDQLLTLSEDLPVLSVLCTPALYSWAVILAFCWAVRRKNRALIAWTVFPFALLLLNFFTPANAYYGRYMLPVMVLLPFLFSFLIGFPEATSSGSGNPD